MKRVSIACVLAFVALIAVPAAASALYYPFGPQAFVDKSKLEGWQLCFSDQYFEIHSLDLVFTPCNQDLMMLAGGPTGSPTLTVLAAAPRADVTFDTGTGNTPHNANGTGWYFNPNWSWGFAKQGDVIERDECDVEASSDGNPNGANPDLRLCWHTLGGDSQLSGGYRAGATTGLNDSTDYTRYVYQAPRPSNTFTVTIKKLKVLVGVEAQGDVSVVDDKTVLAATASKKKSRLLLKPSSASGNPPTIAAPLLLTKTAKRKLRQNGKLTVKARITFTPLHGLANTRTAKLKIKGKRKKK